MFFKYLTFILTGFAPKTSDVGWISHCEKKQTVKKYKIVLTQVVANRTSLQALSYQPSLGFM